MFLAIVVAVSGYATIDRHITNSLGRGLGTLNAQAVVLDGGGYVGDIAFGRYSTIIKPVAIPTSAPSSHTPLHYTVQSGETLSSIATKYGVTVSQIRWSNAGLFQSASILPGMQIIIPPTPGVVVTIKNGDTLQSLANAYKADPAAIADYNRLRSNTLTAGSTLVIPGGVGPAFPPPPVVWQPQTSGAMKAPMFVPT